MSLLLDLGADPAWRDMFNRTPADTALLYGHTALAAMVMLYRKRCGVVRSLQRAARDVLRRRGGIECVVTDTELVQCVPEEIVHFVSTPVI